MLTSPVMAGKDGGNVTAPRRLNDSRAAVRPGMGYAPGTVIPVIDVGPCFFRRARRARARRPAARRCARDVGFFVLVNHGVPRDLIDRTFAEARRFHAQPLAAKMALRHERAQQRLHGDGPLRGVDLRRQRQRQARSERGLLHQARASRRTIRWCARAGASRHRTGGPTDLPGFRDAVLAYTDAMDELGAPAAAGAARWRSICRPTAFDAAFAESQFSFRLSHYPPVAAEANQYGIAPHTDANFLTFLAQSEVPGLQVRMPSGEWIDVPYVPGLVRGELGRHDVPLDERPLQVDAASRAAAGRTAPLRHPVLPRTAHRHGDRVPADLPGRRPIRRAFRRSPTTAYLDWWYDANYNAAKQNEAAATPS